MLGGLSRPGRKFYCLKAGPHEGGAQNQESSQKGSQVHKYRVFTASIIGIVLRLWVETLYLSTLTIEDRLPNPPHHLCLGAQGT